MVENFVNKYKNTSLKKKKKSNNSMFFLDRSNLLQIIKKINLKEKDKKLKNEKPMEYGVMR